MKTGNACSWWILYETIEIRRIFFSGNESEAKVRFMAKIMGRTGGKHLISWALRPSPRRGLSFAYMYNISKWFNEFGRTDGDLPEKRILKENHPSTSDGPCFHVQAAARRVHLSANRITRSFIRNSEEEFLREEKRGPWRANHNRKTERISINGSPRPCARAFNDADEKSGEFCF